MRRKPYKWMKSGSLPRFCRRCGVAELRPVQCHRLGVPRGNDSHDAEWSGEHHWAGDDCAPHANPGAGALLTLNPTGNNQERLKVTRASRGPRSVYLYGGFDPRLYALRWRNGLVFARCDDSSPHVGVRDDLGTEAIFMKRLGVAGRNYRLQVLATLADGQKIFYVGTLAITET